MSESHAAGWALDSPTPDQLKEFFAQVAAGRVTKDRFQAFLRGDTVVVVGLTEAERVATVILGAGRVLGYRDVSRVQQISLPEVEPVMTFSEDVLRECAEENSHGANWRLAFYTGHSLRQEYEVMGKNRKKQPCFDPDYTWWLESAQDPWTTKLAEPGYRLLDFTKRFSSLRWQDEEAEIAKLGSSFERIFERAEEQAVAEICFSNFLLNNKERLLPNWYHWGRLQSAEGDHVYVGYFDQYGFHVHSDWDDSRYDNLGVVLARKS